MSINKSLQTKFLENLHNENIYNFLRILWIHNFESIGFGYIAENIFEDLKKVQTFEEIIHILENSFADKDLKRFNRKTRKHGKLNEFTYSLIKPYLSNINSYLDFGCGKMGLIRRILKEEHNNIKKLYGFEPNVAMEYLPKDKRVEFISAKKNLEKLDNIDLITINFVLHHLEQVEIKRILEFLKSKLGKNGRFIILEESFPENLTQEINNLINDEFLNLTKTEKLDVIFTNDILINYKNLDYMPWTMQYKSMEEWESLFEEIGFRVQKSDFIGITDLPRIKRGMTAGFEISI